MNEKEAFLPEPMDLKLKIYFQIWNTFRVELRLEMTFCMENTSNGAENLHWKNIIATMTFAREMHMHSAHCTYSILDSKISGDLSMAQR